MQEPSTPGSAPDGCAYPVAERQACGAPRRAGSAYCAEHHARCHLPRGSRAEARWLARLELLARAAAGRCAGGSAPPRRFLDRLERIVSS